MKKIKMESKFGPEEIEANFKNFDYFETFEASLKEALAYEKGAKQTVALRYDLDEVFLKDLHPIDPHTPVELFAEFAEKAIKEEYEVEPISFGVEVDFDDGHLDIYDIQI